MFPWRSSAFALLLTLHFVSGSWAVCQTCDFVCDCDGCSDEQDCGYSGRFTCDFDATGWCGWTDQSSNATVYSWQRLQREGNALPDSGPTSDYSTGTAAGWFVGVSALTAGSLSTAVLVSPVMQQSSPTCRLRLRYFLWDSGHVGLGSAPLWASILRNDSQEAVVWRPEATSGRGWREDTVFLGRVPTGFRIRLHSQRSLGQRADVAVDQLEFLDCALPTGPPAGEACPPGMTRCRRGGCVEQRQLCDGSDDCGDGTDEETCDGYQVCDFEQGLCDWDLRSISKLQWARTNQVNISDTDPLKGPGRDHSNNTAAGHFLYVTVPDGGLTKDWAAFQSPHLEPITNTSQPCKMVMYTHQFGPRSGGLSVLVAGRKIEPVWQRGGALGDVWVKAEVEIVEDSIFQILIVAAVRDFAYGGIAVDSIVLSPQCRPSSGNGTLESFPKPPKGPCAEPDKMCDFQPDCAGGEDEDKCGDFSSTEGSSGWTDASIGSQWWVLHRNETSKEEYLYVSEAPGQQLTEAQTRTPLLGPSGPACTLSFDFALTGNPIANQSHLSVRLIDSLLGMRSKLWEFSGTTGTVQGAWLHVDLPIGARRDRFQLAFEASAMKLPPDANIKVQNVSFVSCNDNYFPASPTGLSCNFEDGLCAWYQDHSGDFDWAVMDGMDHTIGIGRSLVVDMWSPSLRGAFGRLVSYTQPPVATDHCLFFFYKLYGPNTGTLRVKLLYDDGYEVVIWTRSAAQGNVWHEAHCPVPDQLTNFQLLFEAVRSGSDGHVAIDDVAFVEGPCAAPRVCSFEGQPCGYSSSGRVQWLHRSGRTVTLSGPETDHTLETALGFYMLVNTGQNFLPSGGTSVLNSPLRQGSAKTECVHFWYHMGGANPGSLTLYMKPVKGERVKIFSDSMNQGDVWRHGNGNITTGLVDWQLEFEVVGAGGKDTHVAVDDIFLSAHPCEDGGSKCSLERGMCSWSNTQNVSADKLDWELTSREAESHYPTPAEDHSLGTERGHFLFLPSSNRTAAYENARLLSPHLPPTKGTCLKFWAYKAYSSDSQLRVGRLSQGLLHQLLVVSELGGPWKRFDVNITSAEEYQIVLEGIKGTSGVVALDDIEYTDGVNCGIKDGHTTSSKGDMNGGIAAAVIVVLLLMGTLIALLVYYLRTRHMANGPTGPPPPSSSVGGSFTNEVYEPTLKQDRVIIPVWQDHPMAAGFNNVPVSADVRERVV